MNMANAVRLQKVDSRDIPAGLNEIRLFLVGRNESLRLPYLLRHYRALGVDRFFIVDNDSNDRMSEIVAKCDDVHVFYTKESYKENLAGMAWINHLLDRYGTGRWCLTVDADEIFCFPHSDSASIRSLCDFLDTTSEEAVFCLMIDMYSDRAVEDTVYQSGRPFLESACYFDRGPYYASPMPKFPFIQLRGGVRKRIFWPSSRYNEGPALNKVPLIKWRQGLAYTGSTHTLHPAIKLSQLTGVILHFKYFSDFSEQARKEYDRNDRPHLGEYMKYAEVLESNPKLSFFSDCSERFLGPDQLIALKLMRSTWSWSNFIKSRVQNNRENKNYFADIYCHAVQNHDVSLKDALNIIGLYR